MLQRNKRTGEHHPGSTNDFVSHRIERAQLSTSGMARS
jgi:hypothetical protein